MTSSLLPLHRKLIRADIPVVSVYQNTDGLAIEYDGSQTPQQVTDANTLLAAWAGPPDWNGFMDGLASIDDFFNTVAASTSASIINSRLMRLATGQSEWLDDNDVLVVVWNAAPPVLDASQRLSLISLANTHNIPLSIDTDNLISAT